MKFTFIEKKMAPSDSLRAYAEKKVSKIDRLFRTESEANVTFSTERGRFTAEITIKNNGTFFRAHETTSDMYASVDSAVATIERQIRKNKTRLAKKLREGAFEREVQPEYVPADDTVEAGAFEVVRRKRFPIKPMSVEEAILQMDLLEHTFFVFRDVAADGAVSVVYRPHLRRGGVSACPLFSGRQSDPSIQKSMHAPRQMARGVFCHVRGYHQKLRLFKPSPAEKACLH